LVQYLGLRFRFFPLNGPIVLRALIAPYQLSERYLMMKFIFSIGARGLVLAALITMSAPVFAQQGAEDGEWRAYSGDKGSTKYSALDQINRDNVVDLEVAWRWRFPDNDVEPGAQGEMKVTPLVIDGVMYTTSMYQIVSAIDAKTGETIWSFDPEVWKEPRPGNLGFNARGLAYWTDGEGDDRIILGTQMNYLYALDAKTGKLCEDFADNGTLDLLPLYRRKVQRTAVWAISPAIVVGDMIVIGRAVNDVPIVKEGPPGDVFGIDVRTGERKWTFFNPPLRGKLGANTWKEGSIGYSGNSNVWTHMSADEDLGLVYLPFGTPTNDWYGGQRKGDNLFAESLVAVNAQTGEYVWHFQTTHHGLWDYDLPTAPALVDIKVDGKPIKALAQATKQAFLFVLDRETGEPVWPIEERAVPQSSVPGEETAATQPFPTKPAAYMDQGVSEDILIDYTPELKAEAIKILEKFNVGPLYTPPMSDDMEGHKPTIYNPGLGGGANWYGVSVDPDTGWIYIPSYMFPMAVTLTKPDGARSNLKYVPDMQMMIPGPQGLPLFRGPYSKITAIDLNTGDHMWQTPLGDGPTNRPALKDLDLEPQGGFAPGLPVTTKTLLFAFSRSDRMFGSPSVLRALDKKTGEIVAEVPLENVISLGVPMTYQLDGKQYFAFAATSGGGAEMIAMALP
jgi:quinoprotein glucose dehydrogenase